MCDVILSPTWEYVCKPRNASFVNRHTAAVSSIATQVHPRLALPKATRGRSPGDNIRIRSGLTQRAPRHALARGNVVRREQLRLPLRGWHSRRWKFSLCFRILDTTRVLKLIYFRSLHARGEGGCKIPPEIVFARKLIFQREDIWNSCLRRRRDGMGRNRFC